VEEEIPLDDRAISERDLRRSRAGAGGGTNIRSLPQHPPTRHASAPKGRAHFLRSRYASQSTQSLRGALKSPTLMAGRLPARYAGIRFRTVAQRSGATLESCVPGVGRKAAYPFGAETDRPLGTERVRRERWVDGIAG